MLYKTTYQLKKAITLLLIFTMSAMMLHANVYVVFYTTVKGKTGHAGIAIDSYDIFVHDLIQNNMEYSVNDTQATGRLIYYDL